ncbi:MAG: 30S ribosomal protein S8 [Sedimentisphaerales bacterium]|nr:30S ribosomal protein S8 [Sedimentisphaerales bacterium]
MSLTDPIADMLTRIRNAIMAKKTEVTVKASNVCVGIAGVLKEEGYILDYDRIEDGKQGLIRIKLKYDSEGRPAIQSIDRISKPGRRVYRGVDDLPKVCGGLGIAILSTHKGVLSDRVCRQIRVGGEVLCTVS